VENVAGAELSWYWRSFWYTTDVLDLGIDGVEMGGDAGRTTAAIALRRHTSVPFPPVVRLKLADGSTRDVRFPVDVWARPSGGDRAVVTADVPSRVVGARLWPDPSVPDWNPANDTWGDAPAADPVHPVTGAGTAAGLGGATRPAVQPH
jgi:hypothetical protein